MSTLAIPLELFESGFEDSLGRSPLHYDFRGVRSLNRHVGYPGFETSPSPVYLSVLISMVDYSLTGLL